MPEERAAARTVSGVRGAGGRAAGTQVAPGRVAGGPAAPPPPLLRAKLAAPGAPPGLIRRPRLFEALERAVRGPVTVLEAPAGWGKTVLLSSWVQERAQERRAGRVAWLSVEPDDQGGRFWRYLCAALDAPVSDLARLVDVLARRPEPAVLILDDFQHVRDPEVLGGLDFVLRHAPGSVRLVLASRAEPALALHRWRIRGEVAELRTAELSFTVAETEQVLARDGLALPANQVSRLQTRTEGWPAGVRLAATAIGRHPDPAGYAAQLGGDDPCVAEYLVAEVLADQPGDVRDLLLSTSILERISADSIEALTGRTDGERVLAALRDANGYVIPVDAQRHSYRHHRMFGELLRSELRRQAPERLPELHRRAARWHAERGLPLAALRHALAARDWGYATGLLVEHWHQLVEYGHSTHEEGPTTLVSPPPDEALRADPELALAYAADRLDLRDLDSVAMYLRLAASHEHLVDAERRDRLALMTAAFRLTEAQLRGEPTRILAAAEQVLALADRYAETAGGAAHESGARAMAYAAAGAAHLASGDLDAAEAALTEGLRRAESSGLPCPRQMCASRLAFAQALRGQLHAAAATADATIAAPACGSAHQGYAFLALALVQLDRDQVGDAEASLRAAAAAPEANSEPALAAWLTLARARLLCDQAELTRGYQVLLAGRRDAAWRPPHHLEQWFAAVEGDLRIAHGDTETARRLLAPAATPQAAVTLAHAYLRDNEPAAAIRMLPPWAEDGSAIPLLSLRLSAGLIEALAARRTGDSRRATRALERVLALAEPEGIRRPFMRAGEPVREMLLEHLDSGTAYWPLATELIAASDGAVSRPGASVPPGEALTDRELTILRYLQSILSNVEIAAELSVSVNTVKTHVRNIYRKLHATRRRDAVRRARELHLL
jgi:LuxR family transcriptional regulator, maltose regulon positive regulatory protein